MNTVVLGSATFFMNGMVLTSSSDNAGSFTVASAVCADWLDILFLQAVGIVLGYFHVKGHGFGPTGKEK